MNFIFDTNKINYIKIQYNDFENKPRSIKTTVKRIDDKEIFVCAKTDNKLFLPMPQDVMLNIVCDNGLYQSKATLKYLDNKPPYVYFTLINLSDFEYQQNREYFRVKMDAKVNLSYKYRDKITQLTTRIFDISAGGIRVLLPERINIPEETSLEICFDNSTLKVNAEFIRFDNEDNILKASFKFINLSELAMNIISKQCIQKQLNDKRKNFS